ncbi:hypothetical protein, partial [Kitasatospora sp. NPDC001175]|uniref:hypothetical protein n=1 Tax=Kitasatospora sp. NPDC001175 TaxID=3157103 RepID=UPI003CFDCCE6
MYESDPAVHTELTAALHAPGPRRVQPAADTRVAGAWLVDEGFGHGPQSGGVLPVHGVGRHARDGTGSLGTVCACAQSSK